MIWIKKTSIALLLFLGTSLCQADTLQMQPDSNQLKLAYKFAHYFSHKDAEGIGLLSKEDLVLYEPGRVTKGKEAIIGMLKDLFDKTALVSYRILKLYEQDNTTVLEFKITLDNETYNGVDFIEWESDKIKEIRCYFNPPGKLTT